MSQLIKPADGSTLIGKSVQIKGELSGSEDLFLDGRFEGSITLAESRLTIGPNAQVDADLNVRDLVVLGVVTGNINATGRIELRQSAIVNGDIVASRLSIEESASVRGRVELTGQSPATSSAAGAAS